MRIAYQVLDAPARGRGAFAPIPASSPTASTNGGNVIFGAPGTSRVPAPWAKRAPSLTADGKITQDRYHNPEWWLPALATPILTTAANGRRTLAGQDHPLPAPAAVIGSVPVQLMNRAKIGGNKVIRSVRTFIQWPTYGGN